MTLPTSDAIASSLLPNSTLMPVSSWKNSWLSRSFTVGLFKKRSRVTHHYIRTLMYCMLIGHLVT